MRDMNGVPVRVGDHVALFGQPMCEKPFHYARVVRIAAEMTKCVLRCRACHIARGIRDGHFPGRVARTLLEG